MGRTNRIDFPFAYHHVMNRAGAKRLAFHKNEHRQAFFEALEHVVKTDSIEIHAYCLMGNHFHLLMRSPKGNLSEAMQRLSSMFTRKFNRIEGIDGSLFRGRFKSRFVCQDEYLRELFRYIHRNPVEAKMVRQPSDYAWSSYRSFVGIQEPPKWLTCQDLPNYFLGPAHLLSMRAFVEADTDTYEKIKESYYQANYKDVNSETNIVPNKCMNLPPDRLRNATHQTSVSLQIVLECVGEYFRITADELLIFQGSKSNGPREICLFLARQNTGLKVIELANAFSICRTSTSSAITRARQRIERNEKMQNDLHAIMVLIRERTKSIEKK